MSEEIAEEKELQWTDKMLSKYEETPVPTLYEYLLNQEKLVAEIRKQNKELRTLSIMLTQAQKQITDLAAQNEALENKIDDLYIQIEETAQSHDFTPKANTILEDLLKQALDSLLTLQSAARQSSESILKLLPNKSSIWNPSPPKWRPQAEEILRGFREGVDAIHDKMLSYLTDVNLEVIIPQLDAPFDPAYHRAIKQIDGGISRNIAQIVRYGYTLDGEILRYAEVVVYK